MSEKLIKINKNIHQIQAGGNRVLIAYEGTLVNESVLLKLGYKIEDVSDEVETKVRRNVEDKAVKPKSRSFKDDAKDGDQDGKVQDGTPYERPARRAFKSKGE